MWERNGGTEKGKNPKILFSCIHLSRVTTYTQLKFKKKNSGTAEKV